MARVRYSVLFILVSLFSKVLGKATVSFIDSSDGSYLKRSGEVQREGIADLSAIVTSLFNLPPLTKLDADTSKQVAKVVKASPFERPEAVAVLNMAGAPSEGVFAQLQAAQTFEVAGQGEVLNAILALARAEGVEHTLLDVGNLPGCGEVCLEAMLQYALSDLGIDANYSKGTGSLRGQLTIRASERKGACTFYLQEVPDRLLAVELISTWKTVSNAAADKRIRQAQGLVQSQPQLIERTLVSLQAIREAYGTEAPRYAEALHILQRLVDASVQKLQAVFGGRIVVIATSFDGEQKVDLASLPQQNVAARSLLQVPGESVAYTENFIAWIAMWCTFFLLLFFALAGCYCLKNMKFKQDSLLYGKNKSD